MSAGNLKAAVRNLRRHKAYGLINILGLAAGMGCALAIFLHIARESGFDRWIPDAARVYRITTEYHHGDRSGNYAHINAWPGIREEFPEIDGLARLFTYSWKEKTLIQTGERIFYEDRVFLSDPSFLDMFGVSILKGDARSALDDPGSIIISAGAAGKYFGSEEPVGKLLSIKNLTPADFVVSAVFRDFPDDSHLHPEFIIPLQAGEKLFWKGFLERNSFFTYVRLRPGTQAADLESKFPAYVEKTGGPAAAGTTLHLQPVTTIHLRSHLSGEIEPNGDFKSVALFAILALIVLASACVNFISLATARAETRALEVGLRKTLGARRSQLVRHFLSESFLMAVLALAPAFLFAELALPLLERITGARLSFASVNPLMLAAGTAGILVLAGFAAGIYPALVLSSFKPIRILNTRATAGRSRPLARNILVTIQSAASLILIIGTLVVAFQMRFIRTRPLGFDTERLVILPMNDWESTQGYPALRTALARMPDVLGVTASETLPSEVSRGETALLEGKDESEGVPVLWEAVDYGFLETYGMTLAAGRSFSRDFATDEKQAYIINETAARSFGWTDPVGRTFALSNKGLARPMFEKGRIIGVVRDFHTQSLHKPIEPLVMSIQKDSYRFAAICIRGDRVRETLAGMSVEWKKVYPERPFDAFFFDESVAAMYGSERRTGRMFGGAAGLCVLIAGLGLYGLASFSAARRIREVGIRKTLGATSTDIVRLMARDFGLLFLAANVLAWPVAYILMKKWLEGFAYRIGFGLPIFLLAALFGLVLLAVSVGSQAWRASRTDPAAALRYE
jgi:putative ABC transport system permease protein